MKKIVFIIFTQLLAISLFAQTQNEIYIIFTSVSATQHNIGVRVLDTIEYDQNTDRNSIRLYTIFRKGFADFAFRLSFGYRNAKDKPDNPIVTKPVSFLNTVNYIDWDIVGPALQSGEQAQAKLNEIKSYNNIYFIDRNEVANGTMKIVPVKVNL